MAKSVSPTVTVTIPADAGDTFKLVPKSIVAATPTVLPLSLILIPPKSKGVTIEPQLTLGQKGVGGTCDVTFEDVRVPIENIVGGYDGWNNGWSKIVSTGLDVEKIEVSKVYLFEIEIIRNKIR